MSDDDWKDVEDPSQGCSSSNVGAGGVVNVVSTLSGYINKKTGETEGDVYYLLFTILSSFSYSDCCVNKR